MLDEVEEVVHEAGVLLLKLRDQGVRPIRGGDEPVSEADLRVQAFLAKALTGILPGSVILGEEGAGDWTGVLRKAMVWIVDPLDGTRAYLAGDDRFGVQVALLRGGELTGAWIECPALGQAAHAYENDGVASTSPASGNSEAEITRAVIADGDFDPDHKRRTDRTRLALRHSRGTTSCAVDYLELLHGCIDLLLYRRTRPWDHAPGVYLARRRGGAAVNFAREPYRVADPDSGLFVVTDPALLRHAGRFLPGRNEG